RLQSNSKNAPLDWVAGIYYARDHLSTNSYYDVLRIFRPIFATPDNPDGFNPDLGIGTFSWPYRQNTTSYAGFGQLDFHFTPALTGTLGLRYSKDKKDFAYTSIAEYVIDIFSLDESKSFSSVSGKLGLQYKFSDDVNAYFTYNRGFKSGG